MTIDEQMIDILRDVRWLADNYQNSFDHERRSLVQRIDIACRSLVGQERVPDQGPWTVSEDGRVLSSDNFEHDVQIKVSGDFYGDEDRIAYSKELASRLNRP
jgi:hypothetical protein